MERESGATRSIIDGVHFSDVQGDQMEGQSGATRSNIDELRSSGVQGDQMQGESGATPSIIDALYSWKSKEIKRKVKVVLLEV